MQSASRPRRVVFAPPVPSVAPTPPPPRPRGPTVQSDDDDATNKQATLALDRRNRRTAAAGYRTDWFCLGAWIFEVFTAVLSVVDVLSDVLVAAQFCADGYMGWCWMVVGSMFVSNVAYCLFGTKHVVRDRWNIRKGDTDVKSNVIAFGLGFLIGQAIPLLIWFYELKGAYMKHGIGTGLREIWATIRKPVDENGCLLIKCDPLRRPDEEDNGGTDDVFMLREDSWSAAGDGDEVAAATRETFADEAASRAYVKRMTASLDQHMKSNFGFYIETVAEAVPQALIQLLAMSATGVATPLQLLSMTLSLVSIVSKAYVVSVSFDLRAVAFKASLVVADVASLFYVFSTVIAANAEPDTVMHVLVPSFLGIEGSAGAVDGLAVEAAAVWGWAWVPLYVTWLSSIWLRGFLCLGCITALTTAVVLSGIGVEEISRNTTKEKAAKFAAVSLCLFCILPVGVIAASGMKLSFVLLPLYFQLSPPKDSVAFFAVTYSFYWAGLAKGPAEGEERLKHILHSTLDNIADSRAGSKRHRVTVGPLRAMQAAVHNLIDRSESLGIRGFKKPAVIGFDDTGKKSIWHQIKHEWQTASRFKFFHQGVAWACLLSWCFNILVLGLVSLAFPFAHVATVGFGALNVLQYACLALSGASMLCAAWFAAFMYRFVTFTYLMRALGVMLSTSSLTADRQRGYPATAAHASDVISAYYKPPQVAVLKAAIAVPVLPHDVTEEVAMFLGDDDIDWAAMSADQCAALRDRSRAS